MADDNNAANDEADNEEGDVPLKTNPKLLWWTQVVALSLVIPALIYPLFLIGFAVLGKEDVPFLWWLPEITWAFCWAAYIGTSIRVVQEDEYAGVYVLQLRAVELDSSYYFIPRFLTELHKFSKNEIPIEIPADQNQIFKGPDDQPLKDGEVRGMRIMTDGISLAEVNENTDPLELRLALELTAPVVFSFQYRGFFKTWERVPGRNWKEKKAFIVQRMVDSADTQLSERMAHLTPAKLLKSLAAFNKRFKKELQNDLGNWGVMINRAHIKSPDIPKAVNQALANLSASVATARKVVVEARGAFVKANLESESAKIRLQKDGEGEGDKIRSISAAQKQAAEDLGVDGAQILAARTLENTVGKGTTFVVGSEGLSQLLALGKVITDKKDAS